jgi:hypothetical protein
MRKYILPFLVVTAILCILYFSLEGFQSENSGGLPIYEQKNMEIRCLKYKTCSTCLADTKCGWAADYADPVKGIQGVEDGSIIACIPQSAGQPFVTSKLDALMYIKKGEKRLTNFISKIGKCTDVDCTKKEMCKECVTYEKCGWQQIMSSDNTLKQSCINKADAGSADPSKQLVSSPDKCPVPQCSDMKDCQTCTNTSGCGFCTISGKCLKESEFGPGTNQCSNENKVSVPAKCPCGGITDCMECVKQVGCTFCKDKKVCVNLDRFGMPPVNSCSQSEAVSNEGQCPGSTIPKLPPGLSGRGESGPSSSELSSASDSGNLIQTPAAPVQTNVVRSNTGEPVSSAKTYDTVNAPGVVRSLTAGSIPATVQKGVDKDDAPLESYIKMLVNSQLAAQGVPTNEPFQVNETVALTNASDYLRKVFRGVM